MALSHPDISDLDALISAARKYKAAIRKKDAVREKQSEIDWTNSTQRQIEKSNIRVGYTNYHAEICAYELHAACVNAKQSKPLGESQYQPRDYHVGPMHRYRWTPAKPRALSNQPQKQGVA